MIVLSVFYESAYRIVYLIVNILKQTKKFLNLLLNLFQIVP